MGDSLRDRPGHTTASALVEYTRHLGDKGNKQSSLDVTAWAAALFFPDPVPLRMLTAKRCAALYDELRMRPSRRTGLVLAAATHRNVLKQVKSFLAWCAERGWIAANPCAESSARSVAQIRARAAAAARPPITIEVTHRPDPRARERLLDILMTAVQPPRRP